MLLACQKTGEIDFYITNNSSHTVFLKQWIKDTDTVTYRLDPGVQNVFLFKQGNHFPPPRKQPDCPCDVYVWSLTPLDSGKVVTKSLKIETIGNGFS